MGVIIDNRAVIYARVSTEEQAKEGYSIDAQINTLKMYSKMYDLNIVQIYKDEGKSGKNINRPELQRLLRDAEEKKFDTVLVWKISRLSRNLKYLLNIVDKLDSYDISFISQSETFNTSTSAGRMTLQILGSIAEFERSSIIENIKLALKEKLNKGEWLGGKVFGYKNIQKRLVIDRSQAEVVKLIFKMYNNGETITKIAAQLRQNGAKTSKGKEFSANSIYRILKNPIYVGLLKHNLNKLMPEVSEIKGVHKPIISNNLFDEAQEKIKKNRFKRNYSGKNILIGHLICPACGGSLIGYKTSKYRYYRCGKYHNYGKRVCQGFLINADYIECKIIKELEALLSNAKYKKFLYDVFKISEVFCADYSFTLDQFSFDKKRKFINYFIDKIYLNFDKSINRIIFKEVVE